MGQGPAITPEEAAEWTRRYAAGESVEEIALDVERQPGTIRKYIDPAVKRTQAEALRGKSYNVPRGRPARS